MPTESPMPGLSILDAALKPDPRHARLDADKTDRRVRKTRQRLQAGLLLLMKEKPLEQITMREICRRVDVGRSTPYAHYRDVQDILEQMEEAFHNDLSALLPAWPSTGSATDKERWFSAFYALAQQNGLLLDVLLSYHGDPAFLARLEALCEAGITAALPAGSLNPAWRAAFLTGAILAMVRQWAGGGCTEAPAELARMTIAFLG